MPRDGEDLPSGDGACGDPEADPGLRALERRAIEQALRASQGNVSRAARRLGIHRSTLYRKLK